MKIQIWEKPIFQFEIIFNFVIIYSYWYFFTDEKQKIPHWSEIQVHVSSMKQKVLFEIATFCSYKATPTWTLCNTTFLHYSLVRRRTGNLTSDEISRKRKRRARRRNLITIWLECFLFFCQRYKATGEWVCIHVVCTCVYITCNNTAEYRMSPISLNNSILKVGRWRTSSVTFPFLLLLSWDSH